MSGEHDEAAAGRDEIFDLREARSSEVRRGGVGEDDHGIFGREAAGSAALQNLREGEHAVRQRRVGRRIEDDDRLQRRYPLADREYLG